MFHLRTTAALSLKACRAPVALMTHKRSTASLAPGVVPAFVAQSPGLATWQTLASLPSFLGQTPVILQKYGSLAMAWHGGVWVATLGACYMALEHNVDVNSLATILPSSTVHKIEQAGSAVGAYLITTVIVPLRGTIYIYFPLA